MSLLVWPLILVDAIVGLDGLGNLLGLLRTSKYGTGTCLLVTAMGLAMAAAGTWFAAVRGESGNAVLVTACPWLLLIVVQSLVLVTGRWR